MLYEDLLSLKVETCLEYFCCFQQVDLQHYAKHVVSLIGHGDRLLGTLTSSGHCPLQSYLLL